VKGDAARRRRGAGPDRFDTRSWDVSALGRCALIQSTISVFRQRIASFCANIPIGVPKKPPKSDTIAQMRGTGQGYVAAKAKVRGRQGGL
jgi:hypothetical protein